MIDSDSEYQSVEQIRTALNKSPTHTAFVAKHEQIALTTAKYFEARDWRDATDDVVPFWEGLVPMVEKIDGRETITDENGNTVTRPKKVIVPAYKVKDADVSALVAIAQPEHARLHHNFYVADYLSQFTGAEDPISFDALNKWKWTQQFAVTCLPDFLMAFKLFMINVKRSMAGKCVEYSGIFGMWEPFGGLGKSYDLECLQAALSDGCTISTHWEAFDSRRTSGASLRGQFGVVRIDELDTGSLVQMKDRVKNMITSDTVEINEKYKNPVIFDKRFQVCISANKPVGRYVFEDESGNQRRDLTFRVEGARVWVDRDELIEFYRTMFAFCPMEYTPDVSAWYSARRARLQLIDEHLSLLRRLIKFDVTGVRCGPGGDDVCDWFKRRGEQADVHALSRRALCESDIIRAWFDGNIRDRGEEYALKFLLSCPEIFEARHYDKSSTYKFDRDSALAVVASFDAREADSAVGQRRRPSPPREDSRMTCEEMVKAAFAASGLESEAL